MKQKSKRTIVDNTNSDFRKRNKTRKKYKTKRKAIKNYQQKFVHFQLQKYMANI